MAQSKKRGHSPEEEKERKRRMLSDNQINFEGPVNPTKWPQCHSTMFTAIRKIEDVRYNNYVEQFQSNNPRSLQKARTIVKADCLVSAAKQCRVEETNEETWRDKTERHLLSTFSNAVECQKCKLLRWPFEPRLGVQETQPNFALCNCIEDNLHGDRQPFADKRNAAYTDRSVPGMGVRRPDRVIGFRKSPSLEIALKRHPDLNSSPGKDARNILFPFLVLEAKAENNSCFSSVESQTALPIKILVDGQKSLRQTGKEAPDTALVWFMSFIGEEWRVYACVPDGSETQIIDLWHGCILRDDCALQLCLIVDLICDWAWNTLHKDIIRLLSVERTTVPSIVSASENDQDTIPIPSNINTVIRDTSEICFKFRHLKLPESNSELTELLKLPGSGSEDVSLNAANLLESFGLMRPPLLRQRFISQLEMSWTGTSNKYPMLHGDDRIFAHISFQSYFPPSDYHIVREISCVTATFGVIGILERLSGKKYPDTSCRPDISKVHENVSSLATGSGQDFLRAAVNNSRLTLHAFQKDLVLTTESESYECEWRQPSWPDEYVSNLWNNLENLKPGNPLFLALQKSRKLRKMSIVNGCSNKSIRALRGGKRKFSHGGIILKTPTRSLKASYPRYCLAVFDGCDLDNRLGLGQKLSRLIAEGKLLEGNTSKTMTYQDRQTLHNWATRLQGKTGVSR
ncbi:hypothetical protein N7504_012068 [Penicillium tannophilum]|nr:hypothetical protein N7504_012068 [Penicillium tannophilum]